MRPLLSLAALAFLLTAAAVVHCADDTKLETIATLKGHKEAVYGVAFTPDGKFLVTTSGEPSVKVYNIATGKEIKSFGGPNGHKQLVLSVAMSPDGTRLLTGCADGTVHVWSARTRKPISNSVPQERVTFVVGPVRTLSCG